MNIVAFIVSVNGAFFPEWYGPLELSSPVKVSAFYILTSSSVKITLFCGIDPFVCSIPFSPQDYTCDAEYLSGLTAWVNCHRNCGITYHWCNIYCPMHYQHQLHNKKLLVDYGCSGPLHESESVVSRLQWELTGMNSYPQEDSWYRLQFCFNYFHHGLQFTPIKK